MDFIAGCFHDGFMLYAKALSEALEAGESQNDGVGVIARMQNRRIWGTSVFNYPGGLELSDCKQCNMQWLVQRERGRRCV